MWKKIEKQSDMFNFEQNIPLEGIYTSKEVNQGPKKNSTIHHIESNGKEAIFWGSTVLDGKLAEVEKEYGFGAKIKITYIGLVRSRTGAEYKDFVVEAWLDNAVNAPVSPKTAPSLTKEADSDIPVVNSSDDEESLDLTNIPF
jgi:hypothetical protein